MKQTDCDVALSGSAPGLGVRCLVTPICDVNRITGQPPTGQNLGKYFKHSVIMKSRDAFECGKVDGQQGICVIDFCIMFFRQLNNC